MTNQGYKCPICGVIREGELPYQETVCELCEERRGQDDTAKDS